MTLVHERDSHGEDFYRIGASTSNDTPENEKNQNKPSAKDAKTRDKESDAKNSGKGDEDDGQEKAGKREKEALTQNSSGPEQPAQDTRENV